jgi:hypothetical protein
MWPDAVARVLELARLVEKKLDRRLKSGEAKKLLVKAANAIAKMAPIEEWDFDHDHLAIAKRIRALAAGL